MADLTSGPTNLVVCGNCGRRVDPAVSFQCPDCGTDLPDPSALSGLTAPGPAAPRTVLEPADPRGAGLVVIVGHTRFTVADGTTLMLGRDDDLPTEPAFRDNLKVSRFHASLRFERGQLYVTDLSSNGTFVGGNRLPKQIEYEVQPGQQLRLASDTPIELDWGAR